MSIRQIIKTGFSKIGMEKHVNSATSFAGRGAIGVGAIAGLGLGGFTGYYAYKKDYGPGGAVLLGVGEAAAFELAASAGLVGIGAGLAGLGAYSAYKYGKENYKRNRRINMGKPMLDNYGTINAMRMRSIQALARNRTGASRVLGNEAQMLHR